MVLLRKRKIRKFTFQAIILLIIVFLINACSVQRTINHQSPPKKKGISQTKTKNSPFHWKLPIPISNGEFFKVGGWLSDQEIVYVTNNGQTSSVYSYNLSSGESKLLFKSEYPIGLVQISPSKEYLLIQAAPTTYEGKVTIIDVQGNEKYTQTIPSYELTFEWNPYQESQVLISKFQADWTFQVYLMDFEQRTMKELTLNQPFLKWMSKDQLLYLNWDHNQQKLFAPLMLRSLADGSEQTLFPKVFQFSAFKSMIMTITVIDKEEAKYSFYDQNLHLIHSFTMPQLTTYSDWLVPNYDFSEKQKKLITLRPLRSTNADTYKEGFQLTSFDLTKGSSKVLFKGLDNDPLALSPSGDACLYGNRFEKIMDLTTKKITDIVKE